MCNDSVCPYGLVLGFCIFAMTIKTIRLLNKQFASQPLYSILLNNSHLIFGIFHWANKCKLWTKGLFSFQTSTNTREQGLVYTAISPLWPTRILRLAVLLVIWNRWIKWKEQQFVFRWNTFYLMWSLCGIWPRVSCLLVWNETIECLNEIIYFEGEQWKITFRCVYI